MNLFTSNEQLPTTMNAEQVGRYLNISRAGAYMLFHTEGFPCIRIGKRLLVQREAFLRWLDAQSQRKNTETATGESVAAEKI